MLDVGLIIVIGLIDVICLIIVVEYLLHRAFNNSKINLFFCRTDFIELNNTLPHSYYENAKNYYSEAQKICGGGGGSNGVVVKESMIITSLIQVNMLIMM